MWRIALAYPLPQIKKKKKKKSQLIDVQKSKV